ncbi:AI-2E family transporter [Acinetobacter larvae]|uniref:AI-2E family transporter n=1 Tax=Acinetobacter larvae TaxID=1789224 RepID=A0A1B2M2E2_9GAMM|nr:AI-2E family transporter [Acinetobacter larvae]AOA59354.1 AI-2E family transporter [Acinetobacter larvae]
MQNTFSSLQRILLLGLLVILVILGYDILKYFIVPVLWASIITYMTWPLYKYILRCCGEHRPNLSASIMLTLVILVVGLPLIITIFMLQQEGRHLYLNLEQQLSSGDLNLPAFILQLPVIGPEVARIMEQINAEPGSLSQTIATWLQGHLSYGKAVVNEISRNLIKLFFVLLTLFFFYRDGKTILQQVSQALENIIGPRVHHYLDTISETTRAVVYGVGLTAIAQALLAGLSYFVAGVPNPTVLTLVTFLFALIPFGTPFAYGAVSLWLFSQGQTIESIGVMLWGIGIVSTADNVIRPIVISGATRIPFILIMFGVLGGIASFGFVGLFIGPVILAILLAIWREWLHEKRESMQVPKTTLLYDDENDA